MPDYAPARRLHELRALLESKGGLTVHEAAEHLGVARRTARRYMLALEAAGEPLFEDEDGVRKVYRLMPSAQRSTITVTTSQMAALFLSRKMLGFLDGTGFSEDLDDVFRRLEATLRRKDATLTRRLDLKLYDINEAPHDYTARFEDVNALVTAVLREDRLTIRHARVNLGRTPFLFEPYSILVYRKGLYVAGYSHHHRAVRPFSLDSIRSADWRRNDKFEYPADYHPSQLVQGAFGLISGPLAHVTIQFTAKVERFVRRRKWHPTQKLKRTPDGGVILTMDVLGTTEVKSWVLGFGDEALVIGPPEFRTEVAEEHLRAARRYGLGLARG